MESGGYHGSDSAQIQHEDKCRWWDDEEFCTCGALAALEYERQITQLRADLITMTEERDALREELKRVKGELDLSERLRAEAEKILAHRTDEVLAAEAKAKLTRDKLRDARREAAESMRERAAEVASLRVMQAEQENDEDGADAAGDVADAIRALPVDQQPSPLKNS